MMPWCAAACHNVTCLTVHCVALNGRPLQEGALIGAAAMMPTMPALALHAMPYAAERDAVFLLRLWRMCLQCMMASTTGTSVASELLTLIRKLSSRSPPVEALNATPFVQVLGHLCEAAAELLCRALCSHCVDLEPCMRTCSFVDSGKYTFSLFSSVLGLFSVAVRYN